MDISENKGLALNALPNRVIFEMGLDLHMLIEVMCGDSVHTAKHLLLIVQKPVENYELSI